MYSGHTYEWVMSHIWMGHVTHMNGSCHTYEWVIWHIWMGHVTDMNGSCDTYEWVMSQIWILYVWCDTHENIWRRHTWIRMNTHEYTWICHMNTHEYVTWIHMNMSHEYTWIYTRTWHVRCYTYNTHEYTWRRHTWIHMNCSHEHDTFDVTREYTWICHTHKYTWIRTRTWHVRCYTYESLVCARSCPHEWVMSHIWLSHVTHMKVMSHDSFIRDRPSWFTMF